MAKLKFTVGAWCVLRNGERAQIMAVPDSKRTLLSIKTASGEYLSLLRNGRANRLEDHKHDIVSVEASDRKPILYIWNDIATGRLMSRQEYPRLALKNGDALNDDIRCIYALSDLPRAVKP